VKTSRSSDYKFKKGAASESHEREYIFIGESIMDGKTVTYYVSPKVVTWDSLTVFCFPFAVGNMDGSFGLLRVYRTLEEFFANCPDEKPVTVVAMKGESIER
jgi:hypothetical protein